MDRAEYDLREEVARSRYGMATKRAAAIAEGQQDAHPADRLRDPPAETLAEQHERAKAAEPRLRHVGGSNDDAFNIAVAEAARQTAWIVDVAERDRALKFVGKAMAGIAPRDEVEGMLAAQMVAMHLASMECMRRAMIPENTIEARAMNLKQGTKASQTYAALLDTLNRHRGKGQQKVTVEHVYVAAGGQAIVGHVEPPGGGGGDRKRKKRKPHAIGYSPSASLSCSDSERQPVPRAGDE